MKTLGPYIAAILTMVALTLGGVALLDAPEATAQTDDFVGSSTVVEGPARSAIEIDLSGGNVTLDNVTRALFVGTGGDVKVKMWGGQVVTYPNVASGSMLPVRVVEVYDVGTTADGLLAAW